MARDTKTYKGSKRDQYTIVLEDLLSKFEIFGEGLETNNKNVVEMRTSIDRLESKIELVDRKLDLFTFEMREINRNYDDRFGNYEERIGRLENS